MLYLMIIKFKNHIWIYFVINNWWNKTSWKIIFLPKFPLWFVRLFILFIFCSWFLFYVHFQFWNNRLEFVWSSVLFKGLFNSVNFSLDGICMDPLNKMEKQMTSKMIILIHFVRKKIYVSLVCDHLQAFRWTEFPLVSVSSDVAIEFEHFLLQKKTRKINTLTSSTWLHVVNNHMQMYRIE